MAISWREQCYATHVCKSKQGLGGATAETLRVAGTGGIAGAGWAVEGIRVGQVLVARAEDQCNLSHRVC
jgi:hypothetical protein